ncbi:MAG TPA: hypothetical protein DD979_11220 [Gammaproteobacteria bacterium]|jgi:pSer/pThr/pTyr-binding forkhead associated (FHA) protein|nr:hypothetical protein [Gammaproteobacteria bacterium]
MPKLVLVFEDVAVKEYALARQELLIGRLPEAAISLDDATVSSRHAILESEVARDHSQTFYIRDLSSRNGTYMDGRRILRKPLHHGDEFRIGWSTFRFLASDGRVLQV